MRLMLSRNVCTRGATHPSAGIEVVVLAFMDLFQKQITIDLEKYLISKVPTMFGC
jgi:hypothetical protein